MEDHWGRGGRQQFRQHNNNDEFYNPPPYEELHRSDQTYSNDDYHFIPENMLLPKPYVSTNRSTVGSKSKRNRSPPPLPPRSEVSITPPLSEARRSGSSNNTNKKSPPNSITPPSAYSASTSGTYMAPNLAALRDSSSLLIQAENSSTGSSSGEPRDPHLPHHSSTRSGKSSNHHQHPHHNSSGRSTSHSPASGDTSSAHSSSLADSGGYLMRTDSGNLFISPPSGADGNGNMMADSPETMRTSVGGGAVADITPLHHGHFGTTISHDSAVATTNTTGGGTMSSRKQRRPSTGTSTNKYQEKMFESVPIRLANIQMAYDPATGVTRPLLYHTDFRSYSALLSKVTSRCSCRPSWRCCSAILLILLIFALLGSVFLILHFVLPNFGLFTGLIPASQCRTPYFFNLTSGLAASRAAAKEIVVDLSTSSVKSSGLQFKMNSPDFVAIDIVKGAAPYGLIGVYGRRFAPPTRYRYDFFKLVDNSILSSAGQQSVIYRLDNSTVGFVEFLDIGQWFLLFANDDDNTKPNAADEASYKQTKVERLSVNIFHHGSLTTGCPADCHGRGFCGTDPNGKNVCQCRSDYTGFDCSMPICPVVCSGRGRLVAGPKCFCDIGWKGSECQVPQSSCEDPNCSGRGQCVNGVCQCQSGYGGTSCDKTVCPNDCSSPRGVCVDGKCYCHQNYAGPSCSVQVFNKDGKQVLGGEIDGSSLPVDSTAETYQKSDIETSLCKTRCKNGLCTGETKSVCECFAGFNGRFCSIEGCPKNCSSHGKCITAPVIGSSPQYVCHCDSGWKDADCSTQREKCSGGVDEDGDSLIDCADPDCCTRALCSQSPTCATVPNPILELLSLPVLPPNSPFADRVSFLLRGVQRGIPQSPTGSDDAMTWLDQKRVSVVAGNVLLAKDKSHLVGVKIYQLAMGTSSSNVHLGYTLSREQGGAFDLLVEGGGVIWLRFEHPSKNLCPQEIAVNVGWNEFKMLEAPILIEPQQNGACVDSNNNKNQATDKTCTPNIVHDHAKISPIVFTTWQAVQSGAVGSSFPYESTITPEMNDPIEMVPIGDTGFSLYWLGNFARSRLANIVIRMTPEDPSLLPDELTFVRLQIAIEGVSEERLFEAEPDLKYTFSWSGKNRFNSESAGIAQATVRIGYVYKNCTSTPVWVVRRTRLLSPICAPVAPPFAGWFLSGHHHFDPQNSILYRSDGSVRLYGENLYLRRMIGQPGRRRLPPSCTNCASNPECRCEGPVDSVRLSRPRDITADRSGNVIILDDNVILRVSGQPVADAKLLYDIQLDSSSNNAEVMELVSIAVHPTQEAVYVADKRGRRVFRINWPNTLLPPTSRRGLQLIAGSQSGQICSAPEQQNSCGDGLPATDALFIQPKSLAFDKFGNLFIADGHVVRRISNTSKAIETYLGRLDSERDDGDEQASSRCWKKPVHRKNGDQMVDWPVAIAVNPLDDSLYVADINNVIYQVTNDEQVIVVAGRVPNCPTNPNKPDMAPENYRFRNIRDIYFSLNGDLYILQSRPAEVLVLTADRLQVKQVTGQRCSQAGTCVQAFNRTAQAQSAPASAADLSFTEPTSLLALPNGAVFVADATDNAVYVLEQDVPTPLPTENYYDVYDPDLDQIHRFDAVGNHKVTVSATTGVALLSFTYHSEGTLQAPLNKVTNPATGYELTFTRTFVENSFLSVITPNIGGQQFSARVVDEPNKPMDIFVDANNRTTVFTYTPESMLLRSVQRPDGQWVIYDYDANTRLVRASTSGATRLITMEPKITENKGVVTLLKSPSDFGHETGYSVVGNLLTIDKNDTTVKKISRVASSVWLVSLRDKSGAISQISLADSRSSGIAGLDGRNWVSLNGNMSVEWRRTSPPSSGSSTMSVGQLLRQLRVTDDSRSMLSASTTISRGISMQLRGFPRDNSFVFNKMMLGDQTDQTIDSSSVAQNIVLIAHLNRTSQPQRETFFNLQTPASNSSLHQQSAVQLLFVTYDDADRPLQVKPAHHKFPTVRLGYVANCRRGRLTSVKFGEVESSWQSDQRGLLKLRSFADGRSYQFLYDNNSTQLQSVSIVGGKELFSLRYDSAANGFQSVLQNNDVKFKFRAVQGLEFSRRILTLPGFFGSKDLEIVLDRGLDFTRTFTAGVSESSSTAVFLPESGLLSKVQFSDGDMTLKTSTLSRNEATWAYKNQDRRISISSSTTSGSLLTAEFVSGSSTVLSVSQNSTSIQVSMPEKPKFWLSTSANTNPGLKVGEFGKIEKVLIGNWTLLYELDTHGRLVHVTVYEPNSRKPLVQSTTFYEIVHQDDLDSSTRSPWRVARTLWHLLAKNELYAHIYEWMPVTENSLLKSVKVERSLQNAKPKNFGTSVGYTWSLPGGNLVETKSATSTTSENDGAGEVDKQAILNLAFKTGLQDQVQAVNGIGTVSYDANGCVSQIGSRSFTYNSLRQLVQVNSVKFSYDAYGRISQAVDKDLHLAMLYQKASSGQILISADIKTGLIRRYHYSQVTGCIDSIQEGLDGAMMAVLTDPWCSPIVGLNPDGSRVLFPSSSGSASFAGQLPISLPASDHLVIGYHGFVHLRQYGIVFVDQTRPVDTVTGRFLCPDFASLLSDEPNQHGSLAIGRDVAATNSRNSHLNLFQFAGPDASRTNFHLLSLDDPSADNFAGSAKAWLAKILAPVSLSQLNDDTLLVEHKPSFANGQVVATLVKHHDKKFGVATRAEMAASLRLNTLASLAASTTSANLNDDQNWPVFVPPPSMTPLFAHQALSRVSLSASFAFGNGRQQVFEVSVFGKASASQHQSLFKIINVVLNGTFFVSTQPSDQTRLVPDFLQYDLVKPNQSATLQSDLALLGHQVTCTDRANFGTNFDVAADCSRNVFVLQTSPNHIFTVHYGVNVKL